MPKLNPRQDEAIRYIDSPLLVLAGAGSGKTRVIIHKIVHLIDQIGLEPRQIAAVTFTNKAANEMKDRISTLLKKRGSSGLRVSTFHTLGLNILRQELKQLNLRPNFSIYDEQDAESLIKELLHNSDNDPALSTNIRWHISKWKSGMQTPEQAIDQAQENIEARAASIYRVYQSALEAYNAVDFDDLIMRPVQLFKEQPLVLERWQNTIRYLLVDEYQDTNPSQYELVKKLIGVRQALTVVGDDDQSIYSWRGARPENMLRLKDDIPRLKVIKLEQNYRSTGRILTAANKLISNNPHLLEKRLWSDLGHGNPIKIMSCRDGVDEAEKVVSEIHHYRLMGHANLSDFAILYRSNHQARVFETTLRQQNIPYFLSGGTSFFSRAEIKDIMSYLRLLANPDDDVAFLRIINTPRREIGPSTLKKLAAYSTERKQALLTSCNELGLAQHLSSRSLTRLRDFAQWVARFNQLASQNSPVETFKQLLLDLDYQNWLLSSSTSDKVAARRWENVEELIGWLDRLHKGKMVSDSLNDIVNHLTLQDILERRDENESSEQVHLMTLHAAKGLEFCHVFLVGMEEELLPHRNSIETNSIEEERRLAYVGITRARKTLTISFAEKRRKYGEETAREPSRFLQELPNDGLIWPGRENSMTQEEKQQRGKAHLAELRKILG